MLFACSSSAFGQSRATTATSLALTSGSSSVSSVPTSTVITLTATVTAGSTSVAPGQVNFCDASAKYCTGTSLLGTVQLNSAGKAAMKLRPGIGAHSYKASFVGTNSYAGSTSSASALNVTGTIPPVATTTTIDQAGAWGTYALSATVTETGNISPLTGSVSFLDSNHANALLGTGALGTSTRGVAWSSVSSTASSVAGVTIATADLNNDGIPDVFVKDYFGTYDVLLGNGDGTFTVIGSPFGPSTQTGGFAVGDFNGDGFPDVAAIDANYYASNNSITIFLGNGDGTFTVAGSSPAIGSGPIAIATADVNADGNADLIISQLDPAGGGQIVVFFGKGDGTFTQAPSAISEASVASQIIPADLNADGKIDLVLAGAGQPGNTILLGNGDGTFASIAGPGSSAAAQSDGNGIAVGDLNNDGIPDLVFRAPSNSALTVFLGNGDGSFTAAPSSPNTSIQLGNNFRIADFNQDGIPDIAYTTASGAAVAFGKGDGTFIQQAVTITFPYASEGFAVADFNGDGWPDVLTQGNNRTFADFLTSPTETASATASSLIPVAGLHLALASYPGDSNYNPSTSGTLPLWGVPPATSTSLTLSSAGGPVTSVAPGTVITLTATVVAGASPVTAGQVSFCDATAASCSDIHLFGTIALSSNGTAMFKFVPGPGMHSYKAVFAENGYGLSSSSNAVSLTVGPAPGPVYTDTTSIAAGGYAGDYSLTATVIGFGGAAPLSGNVSFLDTSFGNTNLGTASLGTSTPGIGWIISPTRAISYAPLGEVAGDFNRDGISDLALLWSSGQYGEGPYSTTILLGKGDGTFNTGTTFSTGINNQLDPRIISGDFNGDGKSDLAVLGWDIGHSTSYVTTVLGNGDGTFGTPQSNVAFNQGPVGGDGVPGAIAAADFNGDGKLDVVVVGDYAGPGGGMSILLGNGDGTFQPGNHFAGSSDYGQVATGDFNGDGIPDLVATNYFTFGGTPTIYLGKARAPSSQKLHLSHWTISQPQYSSRT